MIDRAMIYSILYALAAKDGRIDTLFGDYGAQAMDTFEHSLVGTAFPELWFELPLLGDPWFDLHVLTSKEALEGQELFAAKKQPYYPHVFEWFANQSDTVRQLALSYDISAGRADCPAVQLLTWKKDVDLTCSFLTEAGNSQMAQAFALFAQRIPQNWFACYVGVFPGRPEVGVRVECIPNKELQKAYVTDAALLKEHLQQVGYTYADTAAIQQMQTLMDMPFQAEFQFNVAPDGLITDTLGFSLRFACPPGEDDWLPFEVDAEAGQLMQLLESWGIVDGRWRLLGDVSFAKRISYGGADSVLYMYPAFVKLRWKQGSLLDAKAYIISSLQ